MKITIIGGGNLGLFLAVLFSQNSRYSIFLYSKTKRLDKNISMLNEVENKKYYAKNLIINNSYNKNISDSQYIFITYPSFLLEECLINISKWLKPNTIVVIIPGTGGSELLSNYIIQKKCILIGMQRVPAICRYDNSNNIVYVTSVKPEIFITSIPVKKEYKCIADFSRLFQVKISVINNYAGIAFTNSNPLLHTTRLYSMFKNATLNKKYKYKKKFYKTWNDETSKLLIQCDKEMSKIVKRITNGSYKNKTVLEHYEVKDFVSLTHKIRGIKAFENIYAPMLKKDDKYIIDWNSRYFKEDFLYGLCIIKGYGLICQIETPIIDKIIKWYQNIEKKEYININNDLGNDYLETGMPQRYGIIELSEITKIFEST